MKPIPPFFLEANLYLLVFFVFYGLWLRKETNFQFKRFYLLLAIVASLLFPWISLEESVGSTVFQLVRQTVQLYWLPEVVVSAGQASSWEWLPNVDLGTGIRWTYFAGAGIFLSVFASQLLRLFRLIRQAETYRWNGCLVAESDTRTETFSFFNLIFIGQAASLTPLEKQEILRHERVHARQLHSVDILLSHLIGILFWFNPFLRMYTKTFVQLHEFEADARSVANRDVNEYCQLLARMALQSAGVSLANHFNHSLTTKRITMMQTIQTKMEGWKIAGLLVLFPATFLIVACQKQGMEPVRKADATKATGAKQVDQVYTIVEQMPEFPGGIPKLMEFLGNNIKYPLESVKKKTQGTVFLSFVVDKEGKITEPMVVKGLDAACDQEALRVISQSPPWVPGQQNGVKVNVKYVLPLRFMLEKEEQSAVQLERPQVLNGEMAIEFTRVEKDGNVLIEGTIRNAAGKPLPGASIVLKDATIGTAADHEGHFSLAMMPSSGELVISFVGFESKIVNF